MLTFFGTLGVRHFQRNKYILEPLDVRKTGRLFARGMLFASKNSAACSMYSDHCAGSPSKVSKIPYFGSLGLGSRGHLTENVDVRFTLAANCYVVTGGRRVTERT